MIFDAESCGARIRTLRKENGLTRERLAAAMNITNEYLRRIESGVRGGPVELLIEFAEYFHVSLDYIILGRENPSDEVREVLNEIGAHLDEIADLL